MTARRGPKICGILSWWDESASWLSTAVSSMGRFCDEIVAVDGAYALMPGGRPRSMPAQAEAVLAAAEVADVACTVHRPRDLFWGNEIEKRNLTLRLAGAVLEPGDWVVVVDADQYLMKLNAEALRWDLANTELHVATYTVLDGRDQLADEQVARLARADVLDTEWTTRVHCAYRWSPELRYGPLHWSVSTVIDGERRWLWGPREKLEPALHLNASLVFYHRTEDRALIRKTAQGGYYETRESQGIEKWEESLA